MKTIIFLLLNSLQQILSERSLKITAILNQDAFMPCETRSSLIDLNLSGGVRGHQVDRINLILWYRDGASIPFYTVDARQLNEMMMEVDEDDPIENTMLTNPMVQHRTQESDRFEMDLTKMTPLLRMKNVTEQDDGIYRCRVEHASRRTFQTQIRLMVIGPPISLQITDTEGNQLEGVIGPYNEFENITLICKVFGGNPKPNVVWFRQRSLYEEIVDDSYETLTLENSINGTLSTVVNVLNLRRLDRNDYLAKYFCRARTRFYYYPPLIRSITIDMNLMPVSVRLYMNQYHTSARSLLAGVMVEFGCRAEGSKPNANIEWFLDDQRIVAQSTNGNEPNNQTTMGLAFINNNCIADNQMANIGGKQEETSSRILVDSLNNDNVEHRQTMSTNINYSNGLPFQWEQCKFLSIIKTDKVNTSLSIIRFIPEYTDNNRILSCHASNPFIANPFNKITDKISLNIQYGPIVNVEFSLPLQQSSISKNFNFIQTNQLSRESNVKLVTIGEHWPLFELNCHIKANPWIDQVLWFQNDSNIDQTSTLSSSINLSHWTSNQIDSNAQSAMYLVNHNQTLRMENIQRSYSGYYQCKAFNSINDSLSEIIKLNVAYIPECLNKETQFIQMKRNVPLTVDCLVDGEPSINLTYQWTLSSPWVQGESNDANQLSINIHDDPILDLRLLVDNYWLNHIQSNDVPTETDTAESYSTLLLQCHASNVVGQQKMPCSYLIHIHPGPPQKVNNCTFQTSDSTENGDQKLLIGCMAGNDGGRRQSIHLIGLLSSHSLQKFWNDSLETNSTSFQSLIETIELTLERDEDQKDDENHSIAELSNIKKENIVWNEILTKPLDDGQMVRFQLDNYLIDQSYDLIVYAKNSIGLSEPLTYFNVILDDSQQQMANDQQNGQHSTIKPPLPPPTMTTTRNWVYSRFKGLIVISVFLLVIGVSVALIRSFISTASLNDTHGTNSLAALTNNKQQKRRRQEQEQEEKTNQEELIPVSQRSKKQNQQQQPQCFDSDSKQQIDLDVVVDCGQNQNNDHDTNESAMVATYYSCQQQQQENVVDDDPETSQPKDQLDDDDDDDDQNVSHDHRVGKQTPITNKIPIDTDFASNVKRFWNRSMKNKSRYRKYDLPTCSHENFPPSSLDKRSLPYQEEWEFSIASNSDIKSTSSSSSSSSSSSIESIAQTGQTNNGTYDPNENGPLAKLFNQFKLMANNLNQQRWRRRSKKFFHRNSDRYQHRKEKQNSSEDYEKNIELLYVFNKDLY